MHQVPVMSNTESFLVMHLSAHHLQKQHFFLCQSRLIAIEFCCPLILNTESYLIRDLTRKAVKRAVYAIKRIPYGFTYPTLNFAIPHSCFSKLRATLPSFSPKGH